VSISAQSKPESYFWGCSCILEYLLQDLSVSFQEEGGWGGTNWRRLALPPTHWVQRHIWYHNVKPRRWCGATKLCWTQQYKCRHGSSFGRVYVLRRVCNREL